MVENPRLTFMTNYNDIERLLLAFELLGYGKKDLRCRNFINPFSGNEVRGCVFIGNDLSSKKLQFTHLEDDPQYIQEAFTEIQIEENLKRAHEINSTLPKEEIKHKGSQEIDIALYLENRNLQTLKEILSSSKDKPIHLYMDKPSLSLRIMKTRLTQSFDLQ